MFRLIRLLAPFIGFVIVLSTTQSSAATGHAASLPTTPLHAARLLVCSPHVKGCPHRSRGWVNPCYRTDKNHNPRWSQSDGCPVTRRLHTRLRSKPTSGRGGGANPICRCQSAPRVITFDLVHINSGPAYVNLVDTWSSTNKQYFTLVVVKHGRAWLVDDIYCTYRAKSSIYDSPVKPC